MGKDNKYNKTLLNGTANKRVCYAILPCYMNTSSIMESLIVIGMLNVLNIAYSERIENLELTMKFLSFQC